MKGDEARIEAVFSEWLVGHGWMIQPARDYIDVLASRDERTLISEVKGWMGENMGTATDICYGQLLRRMPPIDDEIWDFALVVPDRARWHAERVDARVRKALRINLYLVSESGEVSFAGVGADPLV